MPQGTIIRTLCEIESESTDNSDKKGKFIKAYLNLFFKEISVLVNWPHL